jgi:hypothetical protein
LTLGNDVYLLSLQAEIDKGYHVSHHVLASAVTVRPLVVIEQLGVNSIYHHFLAVEDDSLSRLFPLDLAVYQGTPAIPVLDSNDVLHVLISFQIEKFEAFNSLKIRKKDVSLSTFGHRKAE